MKKSFLLIIAAALSFSLFAQSAKKRDNHGVFIPKTTSATTDNSLFKIAAIGSIDTLSHLHATDMLGYYSAGDDSGYTSGMDVYEDKGFAERYDFNSMDSTLQVIGIMYYFTGTVNPASTKTVDFKVWSVGPKTVIDATYPHYFYSGLPNTVLTSVSVPFTQLGIGTAADTPKIKMFPTPTSYLSSSFFIGCEINYTWAGAAGDTIGLYTNEDGDRTSTIFTVTGLDTVVNDQSVTKFADNTWADNAVQNFQMQNNYVLLAIVKVGAGLSVTGVNSKNLTFYGNYPNPVVNNTNIKFSLAGTTDVSIQVRDINGRVVNTVKQQKMSAGEHIIPMETTDLAAGDYIYVIRTADGGGIASKMTVIK